MRAVLFILKLGLKILAVPVVLALTLFTWLCFWLLYVSSFIFGLVSTVVALLGIAVLVTYSPQNGVILLVIAFLVSPLGLPPGPMPSDKYFRFRKASPAQFVLLISHPVRM